MWKGKYLGNGLSGPKPSFEYFG